MASTPEGKIKAKLDRILKRYSLWYFSPQAGPYGRAGVPDRIICVKGLFVGVECKADASKKPTALQNLCMRDIVAAEGMCFVVYDDYTLQVFEDFLHDRCGGPKKASP